MDYSDGCDNQEIEPYTERSGQWPETEEPRIGIGSLDRVYRGDATQPGDGVGNGGIAERNKVAEHLVTGLAPLPTKAGERATEIFAAEQGPCGGAPHESVGVGSARGIGPCGFDDEEIEQGADGPGDEQVHRNGAAVGGQIH